MKAALLIAFASAPIVAITSCGVSGETPADAAAPSGPTKDGGGIGPLPDGAIVLADGAVLLADGAVVQPDGAIVTQDAGPVFAPTAPRGRSTRASRRPAMCSEKIRAGSRRTIAAPASRSTRRGGSSSRGRR